jgi:uncharacterized protein (TIGR02246 family)
VTIDAEVAEFMGRLHAAWRAADIDTYMAAFEDDADLVSRTGRRFSGRATITEQLKELTRTGRRALFAAQRTIDSIRIVAPTVAIVHESWVEPDREACATYVLTRREAWRITATSVVLRQQQAWAASDP